MSVRRVLGGGFGALSLVAAGLLAVPAQAAQQSVEDLSDPAGLTAQQLAESLVGDGTQISNVLYTGSPLGAGLATGFEDSLGIERGVVLASGEVSGESSTLIGPNTSTSHTGFLGVAGDADLDAIVSPHTTNDASVLEFDFIPSSDTVTFSYVFGSEEYQEYVDSTYNDVFGFFVNGTNYATVDTAEGPQPVTINSINHKTNSEFYRDNSESPFPFNTELDGFTVVLGFEAPVNAGEVNHLKLAIADASDDAFDSAVLIAAGSFKSNTPPAAVDLAKQTEFNTPIDIVLQGSDPDGDALTFEILEVPNTEHGTLSELSNETVTFTPQDGFIGEASFTYRANDGSALSEPATVTVTVLEEGIVIPTPSPSAEPTDQPEPEPTTEPTTEPSSVPPTPPTEEPSTSPSNEPSSSATATASAQPTGSSTPSATTSASTSVAPSTSSTPKPKEDLVDTGSAGALVLTAIGGALLIAGSMIFMLKRRSARH